MWIFRRMEKMSWTGKHTMGVVTIRLRTPRIFFIFIVVFGISIVYVILNWDGQCYSGKRFLTFADVPPKPSIQEGMILLYNFPSFYKLRSFADTQDYDISCPVKCAVTNMSELFPYAELVVFFHVNYHPLLQEPSNPKLQGQVWALNFPESPANVNFKSILKWTSSFNWTVNFRLDSDIFQGYLHVKKRKKPVSDSVWNKTVISQRQAFRKKRKLVAWFVSNCRTQSRRKEYVQELAKHIPIDIFGECGGDNTTCPKVGPGSGRVCIDSVIREYKFYLAFENSLCKDYVTEKLHRVFATGTTLPVVRGPANYSSLVAAKSVINTLDFGSPQELGTFLNRLAFDEAEYLSYLAWHREYEAVGPHIPLCEMCTLLNKVRQENTSKVLNLTRWLSEGACFQPTDLLTERYGPVDPEIEGISDKEIDEESEKGYLII